jgi:hypothetical protein
VVKEGKNKIGNETEKKEVRDQMNVKKYQLLSGNEDCG